MARKAPTPADSVKPRRKKRGDNGAPPDTNEQAFLSQLRASRDERKTWQEKVAVARTAAGRYRNVRKIANKLGEGLGYEARDIDWLMDALDREPDEIDAETARRTKLAKFYGLPIGSQLGFDLTSGLSVATAVENGEMLADADSDFEEGSPQELAYSAGIRAHVQGFPRGECPANDLADCWLMGWDRQAAIQAKAALDMAAQKTGAAA